MISKKIITLSVVALLSVTLAGCATKSNESKSDTSSKSSKVETPKSDAKHAATTVLDYIYKGKSADIESVTNQSATQLTKQLTDALETKQIESLQANGNLDDYYLVVDGSEYFARDIIKDYAKAYLRQIQATDYTFKSVTNGDNITVTASIKPIASLSEANPIGNARTQLFGGMDEDTFIRQSQNKDLKTIKQLITLKLYAMYYGDLAHDAERVSKSKDITFDMTKKGDSYMVNSDTLMQLAKDARVKEYAK